jgi:hypothetical protein
MSRLNDEERSHISYEALDSLPGECPDEESSLLNKCARVRKELVERHPELDFSVYPDGGTIKVITHDVRFIPAHG